MSFQIVDSQIAANAGIQPGKVIGAGYPVTSLAGKTFWVSSLTGSNGNSGTSRNDPVATIDYAIGLCTASKGDVILCLPGHAESITGAASIAADVAGITIVGLGTGSLRPTLTYSTAVGASVDVSAANVTFNNVLFTCSATAVEYTAMINVTAANVKFLNCEVRFRNSSGGGVLALLTTTAADQLQIKNCYFNGTANANTVAAIRLAAASGTIDDVVIEDTVIIGNFTTSLGGIDNTGAATNILVNRCTIQNRTASSTKAIVLHASTTGAVTNNRLSILSGTAPVTGAALNHVGGNYYTAAAGVTAGTLL